MCQMFSIGKIVNTHGIKGEIKILPTTDDVKRFKKLKEIIVENKTQKCFEVENVRFHKDCVLLKLKGIEDMNSAELLKGSLIKIERKDALPLNKDEYYICDLYGLKVFTEEDRFLGEITDIIETGSNDVYVIHDTSRSKDLLVPAIKQVIKQVDIEKGKMVVHLLEGLEELCE